MQKSLFDLTGQVAVITGGGSGILVVGFAAGQSYASGIIEQAAVYDHLLGSARVLAHYNAGKAP